MQAWWHVLPPSAGVLCCRVIGWDSMRRLISELLTAADLPQRMLHRAGVMKVST